MSFLAAFKKQKPDLTTVSSEMAEIKTLDQARELIATQNAQIQGLETTISEQETRIKGLDTDLATCMTEFGITRKDEDGVLSWDSSNINTLDESLQQITGERDELKGNLEKANKRIAELEMDQRTVSARAREFLAAQGGKPLPVSSNGLPKPNNRLALSEALDEANRAGDKEEVRRLYAELQKLKN